MSDELEEYRSYVRSVKRVLLWGGLSPNKQDRNTLYRFLPVYIIFSCIVMALACTNFCRHYYTNLDLFTKGVSFFGSVTTVILKTLIFFLHRHDWIKNLNDNLEELFENALNRTKLRPALLQLLRHFSGPCYFFTFFITGIFLLYLILPMTLVIIQITKHVEHKHCLLPYPGLFPWKIDGCGWFYQLHYAFESLTSWFISYVTCGVDLLFGFYILRICFVLRSMSFDMEHEKCDDSLMKDIIIKHKKLLKCSKLIQKIYGPIVFFTSIISAFQLCALIFQISQTKLTVGKILLFVFYSSAKMGQILMYSWYGTLLTSESENFQGAVYSSNWYLAGNKSFSNGVMFILRQRPIKLTALKFFYISADLFSAVLNTTFSYFFLLRTLESMDSILSGLFEASFSREGMQPIMLSLLGNFYHMAFFYAFVVTSLGTVYIIVPPISYILQIIKHVSDKKCLIPFPVIFPWKVEGCGLFYQFHFWFEAITAFIVSFVTVSVDILFGYYVQQIAAVLKVISHDIEQIKTEEEYAEKLKNAIQIHNELLKCRDILQTIYGPIVLGLALTSTFIICSLIFQGFQTKMTVTKIILFILYMFLKMSQMGMYSWYGTIVTIESDNFRMAAYNSPWYYFENVSLKRSLLIILSQKTIVIKAMKLTYITVDLFVAVFNTAFSYFFLLKSLDTESA
ncbi:odorant receptor 9a-like [Prorops nasuta]|uniref:odorant receptor 9a-like n=1 Tax=Prorops nasuta TaxID=863751 RepID=UPI0034CDA8F9